METFRPPRLTNYNKWKKRNVLGQSYNDYYEKSRPANDQHQLSEFNQTTYCSVETSFDLKLICPILPVFLEKIGPLYITKGKIDFNQPI